MMDDFRIHLHSLVEGERFTLSRKPGSPVYQMVDPGPDEEGNERDLVVVDERGQAIPRAEIARRNERVGSYFVISLGTGRNLT